MKELSFYDYCLKALCRLVILMCLALEDILTFLFIFLMFHFFDGVLDIE